MLVACAKIMRKELGKYGLYSMVLLAVLFIVELCLHENHINLHEGRIKITPNCRVRLTPAATARSFDFQHSLLVLQASQQC